MWTLKDQIEVYILKYKEELFKQSEDTTQNQILIERLRQYFSKAAEKGDLSLKASYERLTSPVNLARRHLVEKGVKVSKKSSFLTYTVVFFGALLASLLIIALAVSLWFLPNIQEKLEDAGFDYSFYFEEKHFGMGDGEMEEVHGRLPDVGEKRLIIDGKNIHLEFKNHEEDYLEYDCEIEEGKRLPDHQVFTRQGENLIFHLSSNNENMECDFKVPKNLKKNISAKNLSLELDEITTNLNISAKNAAVSLGVSKSLVYDLDLRVQNSLVINRSIVSESVDGIPVFIDVENGKISFEEP